MYLGSQITGLDQCRAYLGTLNMHHVKCALTHELMTTMNMYQVWMWLSEAGRVDYKYVS